MTDVGIETRLEMTLGAVERAAGFAARVSEVRSRLRRLAMTGGAARRPSRARMTGQTGRLSGASREVLTMTERAGLEVPIQLANQVAVKGGRIDVEDAALVNADSRRAAVVRTGAGDDRPGIRAAGDEADRREPGTECRPDIHLPSPRM